MILDPTLRGQSSSLDLTDGLILLLLFCVFMYITFKDLSESTGTEETIGVSAFWDNTSVTWSVVAIGAVGLAVGLTVGLAVGPERYLLRRLTPGCGGKRIPHTSKL